MFVKLTDKNGNVFRSFVNKEHKPIIVINDTEYEIFALPDPTDMNHELTQAEIDEFDADPEIREMIEQLNYTRENMVGTTRFEHATPWSQSKRRASCDVLRCATEAYLVRVFGK